MIVHMDETIRPARPDEADTILEIINAAAQRYKGAIPDDCWHEPYMSAGDLGEQMARGVVFSVVERDGEVVGVMGLQAVDDADLIRHAYVRPSAQGQGLGGRLLEHFKALSKPKLLIGTWAAATWAIGFYEAHGFALAPGERAQQLLKRYWRIPARQAEVSVVLERLRG
ncbi:GNAT family N-acetyltransferase [Phenylobacterium sp.]|jgi:N-acetylglutamate synthase-like GNAT family acetyltransferase|uniref:GNAT family N-acetyltransferase n=1 Tax=Phenylobacterium sp. TaxID=1871053 RepID=UPI002F93B67C